MKRRTFTGLLAGALARGGTELLTVRSVTIPPRLANLEGTYLRALRWRGAVAIVGGSDPTPRLVRLGPGLNILSEVPVSLAGSRVTRLVDAALDEEQNLIFAAFALEAGGRGGAFAGFIPRGSTSVSAIIRPFPLLPEAVAAAGNGRFFVLLSSPGESPQPVFPVVVAFTREGSRIGTIVDSRQLNPAIQRNGVRRSRSSSALLAANGGNVFIFVPRSNEIQQWTDQGTFVRSINVSLPDRSEAKKVEGLFVTDRGRIAITATAANTPNVQAVSRAVFTDGGASWRQLLPKETQGHNVAGIDGDALVVYLQQDKKLLWLR